MNSALASVPTNIRKPPRRRDRKWTIDNHRGDAHQHRTVKAVRAQIVGRHPRNAGAGRCGRDRDGGTLSRPLI
jgi:hypothetical protein